MLSNEQRAAWDSLVRAALSFRFGGDKTFHPSDGRAILAVDARLTKLERVAEAVRALRNALDSGPRDDVTPQYSALVNTLDALDAREGD